jgi:hypothetical protein
VRPGAAEAEAAALEEAAAVDRLGRDIDTLLATCGPAPLSAALRVAYSGSMTEVQSEESKQNK